MNTAIIKWKSNHPYGDLYIDQEIAVESIKENFFEDKLNDPKSINTALARALLSIDVLSLKATSWKLMEIHVSSCKVMNTRCRCLYCNTVKQGVVHGTAIENQVHDSSLDMKSNNMVRTTSDILISRTFQGFFKDKLQFSRTKIYSKN